MAGRKSETNKAIDRALRRETFRELWGAKYKLGAVVAGVLALGLLIYFFLSSKQTYAGTIQGELVGAFAPATKRLPPRLEVTVQLPDGAKVTVRKPRWEPYLADTPVELRVYRQARWPYWTRYEFSRYVPDSDSSNPQSRSPVFSRLG